MGSNIGLFHYRYVGDIVSCFVRYGIDPVICADIEANIADTTDFNDNRC